MSEVVSISDDRMMKPVVRLIVKAAACRANILLVGECGVGKAFLARRIHERSPFGSGSFHTVFCMPDGRGVDYLVDRLKALESGSGTVYVRGVDLLGLLGQRRLLAYLDGREIRAREPSEPVRNRLIFSSHRDLRLESLKGNYMSQLYLRVSVLKVDVPPLRRRGDDIVTLARYFIDLFSNRERKDVGGLSGDAEFFLKRHAWEGNIHELKNAMNRAVVLADEGQLLNSDLLEGVLAEAAV
jgi:DNA-binding NtrC family response regulator